MGAGYTTQSYLSKNEQLDLIIENINKECSQVVYTLEGMHNNCDSDWFEGLKVQPEYVVPYIDNKFYNIFYCNKYKN